MLTLNVFVCLPSTIGSKTTKHIIPLFGIQTCHDSGCAEDLDLRPVRGDPPKGSTFLGRLVEALAWVARQLTSGQNIYCGVFPEQDSWILFPIGMGFYGEAQELPAR